MIALMTPQGFADLIGTMWPEMMNAMPFGMGRMMRLIGKIPGALKMMKPLFPILFPRLLPMMMPGVMPAMLERLAQRVPMPGYMREQMPALMPKVMASLMPHMIADVVPLVTQPMIDHLTGKIRNYLETIVEVEHYLTDDAKIAVVAYGATSRSALHAVKEARRAGMKVGLLRLVTPWPFPTEEVRRLGSRVEAIVVPEINYGQMEHPVREHADCPVIGLHHAAGSLLPPAKILSALEEL